uniref:Calmodulin-binding domain-containing protein n=1 Tax=Plectus sambesii TaxID=2011161 RepID=A0A914VCT3_9BILA
MDNGGRRLAVLVGRRPRLCTKRPIMTDGRQRQQERLGSELAERRRRLCVVGRSSTIGQKTSPSSSPSSVGASLPPPPSLPPPIDGAMSSAPASPSYLRNAAATKNIHSGYDYSSISRAKVSSDILRVSGYSNQFRNLLTNKSSSARRESGPATFQKQHSDASYKSEPVGGGGGGGGADAEPDEKRNGGVSFALLEHRSGAHSRTGSVRVVHGAVHRRQSGYGIAISSDSTAKMRCRQRKLLFIKRNKICDLSLALAIVGIALTILDAELTALGGETGVDKQHPVSLLLRCLCVVSTLFLMVFLFVYHAIEVKIALIDSGADDWRVALTTERIIKLTLEIITCAICPLPGQCRFASYDGELAVEHYYLNSLWFVMVTFMSIGYGDIVPNTYCGRTLSIATGIVGAGVSSALIAVISRKLELSRAEKHVNNFMADSKLTNQRKNAAAAVLQQTWFIHKFKSAIRRGKSEDLRLRHHQRRFLQAINEFRRIKWDQRKLQEKGNSLLDVGKLHNEMHETLWEMHKTQDHLITQVDFLTQKIIALQNTLLSQQPEPRAMSSNALVPTAAVGTGAVPLPPQSALTSQLPPSNGLCQSTSANAIVHLPVPNSSSSSSTVVPMNLMDESMI